MLTRWWCMAFLDRPMQGSLVQHHCACVTRHKWSCSHHRCRCYVICVLNMSALSLCTVSDRFLECRIIQPEWVDTFGRRDARALPGAPLRTACMPAALPLPQIFINMGDS